VELVIFFYLTLEVASYFLFAIHCLSIDEGISRHVTLLIASVLDACIQDVIGRIHWFYAVADLKGGQGGA
jgi:hypothetical protein